MRNGTSIPFPRSEVYRHNTTDALGQLQVLGLSFNCQGSSARLLLHDSENQKKVAVVEQLINGTRTHRW
jgi:hypothetical protein